MTPPLSYSGRGTKCHSQKAIVKRAMIQSIGEESAAAEAPVPRGGSLHELAQRLMRSCL